MLIQITPLGATSITKNMVYPDVDRLYISYTITRICSDAIHLNKMCPNTIRYLGTVEEFARVVIEENNDITCVNCLDGKYIVAL